MCMCVFHGPYGEVRGQILDVDFSLSTEGFRPFLLTTQPSHWPILESCFS